MYLAETDAGIHGDETTVVDDDVVAHVTVGRGTSPHGYFVFQPLYLQL